MQLREINALVENTADPSFAVDSFGRIAAWNDAAEAIFAVDARSAVGMQCNEIVQGTDECGPVCSSRCTVQQAVRMHHTVGNFDLQVKTASGMRWCNISVLVADVKSKNTSYAIHILRQIDTTKRLEFLVRDFVATGTQWSADQAGIPILSNQSLDRNVKLSEREREVLKLLANGVTTKYVAKQLHISRTTVNNHVQHILKKLESHTRLEAIRRAERAGLI